MLSKKINTGSVMKTSKLLIIGTLILASTASFAASKKRGGAGAFGGGSFSMGLGIAFTSTSQDEVNSIIKTNKTAINSTAGELNSATEYIGHLSMRLSNGWMVLQLRPSYFTQSTSGNSNNGSNSYEFTGFTVFPLVRFIPLANDYIDFYMQFGLGYGSLDGKITEGANYSKFNGSGFGTQVGLGADFFINNQHSISVEGNYRYLPLQRNVVSSASGTLTGISQNTANAELEAGNSDLATKLSGILGQVTYTFHF